MGSHQSVDKEEHHHLDSHQQHQRRKSRERPVSMRKVQMVQCKPPLTSVPVEEIVKYTDVATISLDFNKIEVLPPELVTRSNFATTLKELSLRSVTE